MRHLFTRMSPRSQAEPFIVGWTASLVAIRANHFRWPESNGVPMTTDIFGPISNDTSTPSSPGGVSLRTSPTICGLASTSSPETYRTWATALRQHSSARRKSARLTAANVSSSWPTATVKDADNSARHTTSTHVMHPGTTLVDKVNLWRTPDAPTPGSGPRTRTTSVGKGHQVVLAEQATNWPTPREAEYKNCGPHGSPSQIYRLHKHYLDATAVEWDASRHGPMNPTSGEPSLPPIPTSRRRLNPRFVEWLMGLPLGWTDCGC